jgi:hypothetical protein
MIWSGMIFPILVGLEVGEFKQKHGEAAVSK